MCGITGIYGEGNKQLIKKMTDIISHRGPDDKGYYVDKDISLGNRRLSIIDVKGGHQPIHNEDETLWITYNGEIYNFKEIGEELEKRGHKFYTDTDTEVVVHAYEEWGENCLKKFNGMFAFAIWDSKKKKLFLARDRIGIKPLYYTIVGDGKDRKLVFGSEIKSILIYPGIKREIDLKVLHDYLSFKHAPPERTMFLGINKVPPGYFLTIEKNNIKLKQYWDLNFEESTHNEIFYIEKIKELLEDSVRRRLMSEVPLGVYLSGGVDSSSIVAIMSKFVNDIQTFTVGFGQDDRHSELSLARETSEIFGTNHHEVRLNQDDYKLLPKLVEHMDEPIADPASLALYKLSEMTKKHVTVVLTGAGGDEQFGGYSTYKLGLLHQKLRNTPKPIKSLIYRASSLAPRRIKMGMNFVLNSNDYMECFLRAKCMLEEKEKYDLYSDEIKSKLKNYNSLNEQKKYFKFSPLNSMMYYDNKTHLVEDILTINDKMTMGFSIEARVPILDHRIINLAATMPKKLKINGWKEKYIFRKTMKEILPKKIIKRRKRPFRMPFDTYFKENLKEIAENILSEKNVKKRGYFKYKPIKKIVQKHINGNRHNSYQLFNLLVFEYWYRSFVGE